MKLLLAACVAVCAIACSGHELDEDGLPTEEELAAFDTARPWNDQFGIPEDEPDGAAQVDKTRIITTHGWALRSQLYERCFDSQGAPITPCLWGYEPNDTFIGSMLEWSNVLWGRCGRYDSIDYSFQACALPSSKVTPGSKNWTYQIVYGDCPNDSARRNAMRAGVRVAFASVSGNHTNHTFTELTSTPVSSWHHITVRCAAPSEEALFPEDSIAAGFPTGYLRFQHSAPFSVTETCVETSLPTHGDQVRHLADRYFSYNSGSILFHWDQTWDFLANDCPIHKTLPGFYDRAWKALTMHELGHVFGFVHQNYTVAPENVMFGTMTCGRLNSPPSTWLRFMTDTLEAIDFPDTSKPLEIDARGLACYNPR